MVGSADHFYVRDNTATAPETVPNFVPTGNPEELRTTAMRWTVDALFIATYRSPGQFVKLAVSC